MKRSYLSCVALASSLLLLPVVASAKGRLVQIGFGGGVSVPVSDAKNAFKSGFHGQGMVRWNLPKMPLSLRGTLGYERLDLKSVAGGATGSGSILSGLGNVTLAFPVGPVKPYILAGLGAFNTRTNVSGTPGTSQTKFGIDGGVGLEFRLGALSGFIEGKLQNIYTDKGFSSALGSAKAFSTQIIPVTFGIFF